MAVLLLTAMNPMLWSFTDHVYGGVPPKALKATLVTDDALTTMEVGVTANPTPVSLFLLMDSQPETINMKDDKAIALPTNIKYFKAIVMDSSLL
jgi:hypothetical protein